LGGSISKKSVGPVKLLTLLACMPGLGGPITTTNVGWVDGRGRQKTERPSWFGGGVLLDVYRKMTLKPDSWLQTARQIQLHNHQSTGHHDGNPATYHDHHSCCQPVSTHACLCMGCGAFCLSFTFLRAPSSLRPCSVLLLSLRKRRTTIWCNQETQNVA